MDLTVHVTLALSQISTVAAGGLSLCASFGARTSASSKLVGAYQEWPDTMVIMITSASHITNSYMFFRFSQLSHSAGLHILRLQQSNTEGNSMIHKNV